MRKPTFGLFALLLMMCLPAFAQDASQQSSMGQSSDSTKTTAKLAKPQHIKGTIAEDGKSFVSDKDKTSWNIQNPDAVKGHEGHHVVLNAHVYPDKNEVHVMGVKMMSERASKGDKDQTKY
jgi:uncharacterized protein YbaA (DUF1428 family)